VFDGQVMGFIELTYGHLSSPQPDWQSPWHPHRRQTTY